MRTRQQRGNAGQRCHGIHHRGLGRAFDHDDAAAPINPADDDPAATLEVVATDATREVGHEPAKHVFARRCMHQVAKTPWNETTTTTHNKR